MSKYFKFIYKFSCSIVNILTNNIVNMNEQEIQEKIYELSGQCLGSPAKMEYLHKYMDIAKLRA